MYTPLYEESLKLKMKFTELYLCLQIIQNTHPNGKIYPVSANST